MYLEELKRYLYTISYEINHMNYKLKLVYSRSRAAKLFCLPYFCLF